MAYPEKAGHRVRWNFGRFSEVLDFPNLIEFQRNSYEWFLREGLREVFHEIFPIQNFTGNLVLEFLDFSLGEPEYSIEECKERYFTYALPIRIKVRLINKETCEVKRQEVFIVDLPLMTEKDTFIINGAERVIVSQLVYSPGVYFTGNIDTSGKRIFYATIIPYCGPWLEFETDVNERIFVRIDRTSQIPATVLIRALGYGSNSLILELFDNDKNVLETLCQDNTDTEEEALMEIYKRLLPGEPPTVEKARSILDTLFFNPKRYDLANVGRYKLQKKLEHGILYRYPNGEYGPKEWDRLVNKEVPFEREFIRELTKEDIIATFRYLLGLMKGEGIVDDINHLGNRRIRSVGELLQNQFRIGLSAMESVVSERMTVQEVDIITPQILINNRPVVDAIMEFFWNSPLSQYMDQTNPVAELTHIRRITALGPGGLTRERAGFAVRSIHHSHYGRICPIETPEGPNIGLYGSLSVYARINSFGFIETPYRKVDKESRRVTDEIVYLTADYEEDQVIAQANNPLDENDYFIEERVSIRRGYDNLIIHNRWVDYMDVSPQQVFSLSAGLIPFLEHDDAIHALKGVNMQRQAVPLLRCQAPIVGTGIEHRVAKESGAVLVAKNSGVVSRVTANKIIIRTDNGAVDTYKLLKFTRSNQGTCINQKPIVNKSDIIQAGEVLADGAATEKGELSLGRNILVAFMTWEGYNYKDAIIISEKVIQADYFTSIHIEYFECDAIDSKLGPEEITRDIPNISEEVLKDLDERGIIRVGAEVRPGDILVGKVTPKGESELTAEERLLRAIYGDTAREVRDTSFRVPHGEGGKVLDIKVFSREYGDELPPGVNHRVRCYIVQKRKLTEGDKMADRHGNKGVVARVLPEEDMPFMSDGTPIEIVLNPLGLSFRMNLGQLLETHLGWAASELGFYVSTPVFHGASEGSILETLMRAGLTEDGKTILYDGRTGQPFDNRITVGYSYMFKLHHMVDDKFHARSIGPYSMITQQPLGGREQFGGQRIGEMEVWALEAYGAAYTLQEILTVKSDDVVGRVKTYEAIVKGENLPETSVPEAFKVLIKEMQSLGLDVKILSKDAEEIDFKEIEEDVTETAKELGIELSEEKRIHTSKMVSGRDVNEDNDEFDESFLEDTEDHFNIDDEEMDHSDGYHEKTPNYISRSFQGKGTNDSLFNSQEQNDIEALHKVEPHNKVIKNETNILENYDTHQLETKATFSSNNIDDAVKTPNEKHSEIKISQEQTTLYEHSTSTEKSERANTIECELAVSKEPLNNKLYDTKDNQYKEPRNIIGKIFEKLSKLFK